MKNSPLLIFLLVLVIVASGYYAWHTPGDDQAKNIPLGGTIGGNNAESPSLNRFDLSGGAQLKFSPPKNNLFRSLFPPPPVKPAPKVIVAPIAPPEPVVIVQAPPPPPPVIVRSPMPSFQVLGFLEKDKQLTAFVSLQGKIHLVKKNQQFADEFRVTGLDFQHITITRINGTGEVSFPLADAKSGNVIPSSTPLPRPTARPGMRIVRPTQFQAAPFVLPPLPDDQAPPVEAEPPSTEGDQPPVGEPAPSGVDSPPVDAVPTPQ